MERRIKRLSKYEKRLLYKMWEYRVSEKFSGMYVEVGKVMHDIKIPHRSSMSRLLKTLEDKGFLHLHKWNRKFEALEYVKEISLTAEGVVVGEKVYRVDQEETPVGKSLFHEETE